MRISETFIIQSKPVDNTTSSTEILVNNISSLTLSGITLNSDILSPSLDNCSHIGSSKKRFRSINTISGTSSSWNTMTLNTTTINLGLDSNNQLRMITADNSIVQDDTLQGGLY